MRKSRGGVDDETPRQNGSSADVEDHDSNSGALQDDDDDNDLGLRREIRSKYRDLINSVQREFLPRVVFNYSIKLQCAHSVFFFIFFTENREDMLSPSNNKLTEVLEEANRLFKDGMFEITRGISD